MNHFKTLILSLFLLIPYVTNAKDLPLNYSFTATSPEFESSGNVISIYQDEAFAVLQNHSPDESPDFNPVNHWDYNLTTNQSKSRMLVMRNVGDKQFLVKETPAADFEEGITFTREEFNQPLFSIKYTDLEVSATPWADAKTINGLKTKQTTLSISVTATVKNPSGEITHQFKGEFKHGIWISPEIPYSSIAYNLLVHPDTPWFFIEPQNYTITNERPWLSIGNEIYDRFLNTRKPEGMIVKMQSSYSYTEREESYQTTKGSLNLRSLDPTVVVALNPLTFPVIPETLFAQMYDAERYAEIKTDKASDAGHFELKLKKQGTFTGNASWQSSGRYFAIHLNGTNTDGDTLTLVLLKINTDVPEIKSQELANNPISSIRSLLQNNPDGAFKKQFFMGGTFRGSGKPLYFLHPLDGELEITDFTGKTLKGSLDLRAQSVQVNDTEVKNVKTKFKGSFKANVLN